MSILILDVETTTFQNGNPHSQKNSLQLVGLKDFTSNETYIFNIEHSNPNYANDLREIKRLMEGNIITGFNLKFDLLWLLRYIPDLNIPKVIDLQLIEFILSCQTTPYPSLDGCCEKYGLTRKSNYIYDNYWSKGIDTPLIPLQELIDYLKQDLDCTKELYEYYLNLSSGPWFPKHLMRNACIDLINLLYAEKNGLPFFDEDEVEKELVEYQSKINDNEKSLTSILSALPSDFSFDSPKQVSTLLFGGEIQYPRKVPYEKVLKDGTVRIGERIEKIPVKFSGLIKSYNPLPVHQSGSLPSSDEDSLKSYKWGPYKKIRDLLLERRGLQKFKSTYLEGYLKLRDSMNWPKGYLYPSYNQCVVKTGRLASSRPNGQNLDQEIKKFFKSKGD